MRTLSTHVLLIALAAGASSAWAASPEPPTTYAVDAPARPPQTTSVKVFRDGPRERVEMSRANGWKGLFWYDFAAHKEVVSDSSDPKRCTEQKYTSDHAPPLQDPISTSFQLGSQVPKDAKTVGHEQVGGLSTVVMDATDPESKARMKIWLEPTHALVLKLAVVPEKGPPQTTFELGKLSFAKPDPALLVPPKGCTVAGGASNANGGHTQMQLVPPRRDK